VAATVGGRAHAIEDQRIIAVAIQVRRVKVVLGRVDLDVGSLTPVELGEEWLEPMRMLVIDGDWLLRLLHSVLSCEGSAQKSSQNEKAAHCERPRNLKLVET